ncbi:CobQ/CobB/MinD/ParA nucleotide binding domain protein [Acididesulfobacillus acetoxydans]|uniref:CobQ/CobB/MinD/ParA nucleotide binding domain protein n=1 Tax=Acididesulfobacillus acetoxydans TaxID=1561005 RepID=A0A8S0X160_9FIRM|nr:MinD/ParA family protein [Acididesulfobacillus acetoxydans]CAA7602951.1 CobQ/CobB/MinD/ParA nucleotide binding domain protein [Acididesulfobacillus acetoxydans]CEJ05833.1 Flagellum site-determining protein YlxH [Acididesulfobacillus acetoxydans]
MPDQARILREMVSQKAETKRAIRVISVTSGKGGVGKTAFSVNLALALTDYGYRVLILDGDLGMANVDVACGITPVYTMSHLLAGERTIEEIVAAGPKGIGILPGGSGVPDLADLERTRLVHSLANLGRLDKMGDILIIDTGAGLNRTVLNFLRASDDVILLTTPEPTALTDAYALFKALCQGRESVPVNVVVNRVADEGEAMETFGRLAAAVERFLHGSLTLLGWVYEDPLVKRAVMEQVPLALTYPASSAYRCIEWIAGKVSGLYLQPPRSSQGMRGFLNRILRVF